MKKLLLFVSLLYASGTLWAQSFIINGINYKITSPTTVEVGRWSNYTSGAIIIPSTLENEGVTYTVTRIGDLAFKCGFTLNSIVIPKTITSIGNGAFDGCQSLNSIFIDSDTPLTINKNLFDYCVYTATLYVPKGAEEAYKAEQVWKNFGNIVEGVLPTTFTVSGINYMVTSPTAVSVGPNIYNTQIKGDFVIPSNVTYAGSSYSVTGIHYKAFYNNTTLTSLVIPKSVTSIGANAFELCNRLNFLTVDWDTPLEITANVFESVPTASVHLYIPKGKLSAFKTAPVWGNFGNITDDATPLAFTVAGINYVVTGSATVAVASNINFSGSANIPSTVTNSGIGYSVSSIVNYAFANCGKLSDITIPNTVKNIGIWAFYNCGILKSVTIPNSVPSIGNSAFRECKALTSITIPNSVQSIGDNAFADCSSLTTAHIGNSLKTIGSKAFSACTTLTSLNLPNSVTSIGAGAFEFCLAISSINIPNSITIIEASTFDSCFSLISINIPNSVTIIKDGAFVLCRGLTSINISTSVTNIGNSVFYGCTNLTAVALPNALTTIGKYAFGNCSSIKLISIPNSVNTIDEGAFYGCSSITSVSLPNSLINIKNSTFSGCSALKSITIPNTVLTIEDNAFASCTSLISITIPNSVLTIGDNAFASCSTLTSINIPSSVKKIGDLAFYNCISLMSVNIPNSVTTIGSGAFYDCKKLQSITANWQTPLIINADIFGNLQLSYSTLYVPTGTKTAYQNALVWKDFGAIIELSVLPLTLTSLTAKAVASGNQINWSTANIVNVKNIILERSGADNNFSYLTTLPITASQFIDFSPLASDNYYRLSTIDNDGSTKTYPQIAFVKGLSKEVSFYPNPISNGVLNVVAGDAKLKSVALFDLNGRKVVLVNSFNNSKNISVNTQCLTKGVYLLQISSEKGKLVKKVVVN